MSAASGPFVDGFDSPSGGGATRPGVAVSFGKSKKEGAADTLVLPVYSGGKLGYQGRTHDAAMGGFVSHAVRNGSFKGQRGQTIDFIAPPGAPYKKVVLLGMGKPKALDAQACDLLGSPLYKALLAAGAKSVQMAIDTQASSVLGEAEIAAKIADGAVKASYRFRKYMTREKPSAPIDLAMNIDDCTTTPDNGTAAAYAQYEKLEAVTKGVFWARDLVNEPGNVLYPESYAKRIEEELKPLGINVKIIDATEMEKLGMGAALAVGQGSARPPCMVVMEYDGTGGVSDAAPLALVGKGITFDTGGISIKPSAGMGEMKMDMGGSAAVVGAMRALAGRKARTKAVAIVALAENMPSGTATRPGDIVKSMKGLTIDISNTDAEGRLVLADALTYVQRTYKPHTVIDLATLTGACVVALGNTYAGVFSNSDKLWRKIEQAGARTREGVWRLPLHQDYSNAMKGKVSDLNNSAGREAGASTAAAFLHNFIEKDDRGQDKCRWAHIDIAGAAMPPGGVGNGYGVQLLDRLIRDNFESLPKPAPVNDNKGGDNKKPPAPQT